MVLTEEKCGSWWPTEQTPNQGLKWTADAARLGPITLGGGRLQRESRCRDGLFTIIFVPALREGARRRKTRAPPTRHALVPERHRIVRAMHSWRQR